MKKLLLVFLLLPMAMIGQVEYHTTLFFSTDTVTGETIRWGETTDQEGTIYFEQVADGIGMFTFSNPEDGAIEVYVTRQKEIEGGTAYFNSNNTRQVVVWEDTDNTSVYFDRHRGSGLYTKSMLYVVEQW